MSFKILFLSTFRKGQKMAKWPNHFISGKQFQKRLNGNPASLLEETTTDSPGYIEICEKSEILFTLV